LTRSSERLRGVTRGKIGKANKNARQSEEIFAGKKKFFSLLFFGNKILFYIFYFIRMPIYVERKRTFLCDETNVVGKIQSKSFFVREYVMKCWNKGEDYFLFFEKIAFV
jgi:hypothetical protein